jgi:hypothetical protein
MSDPYVTADGTDVLLAVEATLTENARDWWLRKAWEMYPRLRGAKVADVLEALVSTDSWLPQVEGWFTQYGDALCDELGGAAGRIGGAASRLALVTCSGSASISIAELTEKVVRSAVAGEKDAIGLLALEACARGEQVTP